MLAFLGFSLILKDFSYIPLAIIILVVNTRLSHKVNLVKGVIMSGPNPQDPLSPLYDFIDEQPESEYPATPDSSLSHFTERQKTPEAITAAWPPVVTLTSHGFLDGQAVRATKFITTPFALATGMEQLNNRLFYVQQETVDTFQLYDASGLPIDGRNYTTYISGGQFTLAGNTPLIVNPSHFPPPGIPVFPPV